MVAIPKGRTEKQPIMGFCLNPECRGQDGLKHQFQVDSETVACPKCGANKSPIVGVLALVHLALPAEKGPLQGSSGRRFKIGCDAERAYVATATNLEAITGDPVAANCPGCLAEANRGGVELPVGQEMVAAQAGG